MGLYSISFEPMWVEENELAGLIENWWKGVKVDGRLGFALAIKIKIIKLKIKEWAKSQFGDVGAAKKNIVEEIRRIDKKEETCQLTEDETHRMLLLNDDYHIKVREEEIKWWRISRCSW